MPKRLKDADDKEEKAEDTYVFKHVPTPVSSRYQRSIERHIGQQRLPIEIPEAEREQSTQ